MKRRIEGVIAAAALLLAAMLILLVQAQARYMPAGYCVWVREEYIPPEKEPEDGLVYLGKFYVTGYDACMDCCGKTDGITASGTAAAVGATCAADMPFGTILYIDGIGVRRVEDRGVSGDCVDVFCADHAACYAITGWYDVWEVTA